MCWVCVGVLESSLVLVSVHQLSISLSQLLDGLINPTLLAWMNCVPMGCCYPWLCVSLLVPYSLGNHAHLRGGSVVERLRSTQAYVWVERCSDVAGYGTSSL